MKNKNLLLLLLLFSSTTFSQNVGINATGAAPVTSAALDVDMANKGILIPRVALTSLNVFAPVTGTPTVSLLVYNTATAGASPNNVTPGYYYWDGNNWQRLVDLPSPPIFGSLINNWVTDLSTNKYLSGTSLTLNSGRYLVYFNIQVNDNYN